MLGIGDIILSHQKHNPTVFFLRNLTTCRKQRMSGGWARMLEKGGWRDQWSTQKE